MPLSDGVLAFLGRHGLTGAIRAALAGPDQAANQDDFIDQHPGTDVSVLLGVFALALSAVGLARRQSQAGGLTPAELATVPQNLHVPPGVYRYRYRLTFDLPGFALPQYRTVNLNYIDPASAAELEDDLRREIDIIIGYNMFNINADDVIVLLESISRGRI